MANRLFTRSLVTSKQTLSSDLCSSSIFRLRPLVTVAAQFNRVSPAGNNIRGFATHQTASVVNDPNPNWSNRPQKETVLVDGLEDLKGSSYTRCDDAAAAANFNVVPQIHGYLGAKMDFKGVKERVSLPCGMSFRRFMHSSSHKEFEARGNSRSMIFSSSQKEVETGMDSRSMNFSPSQKEFETARDSRSMNFSSSQKDFETWRNSRSMNFSPSQKEFMTARDSSSRSTNLYSSQKDFETERNSRSFSFARGIIEGEGREMMGGSERGRYGVENNADVVHIKMLRNNTFVTLTDSKGKVKIACSSGNLSKVQGGAKLSRYAAEATAEHIGRQARDMGVKSVVMKVNGFTYFKKKKLAIVAFREGFTHSRSDRNPIVYIEDTTRKAHNGCRLPKKRRV